MGATYWMVPDESRTDCTAPRSPTCNSCCGCAEGVTAIIGSCFGGHGQQAAGAPLPHKIVIVIVMLMFLYNIGMTIKKSGRFTTTEGVLLGGLAFRPCCTCRPCSITRTTRLDLLPWWTIHLWVEGVWEMIQGGFLAYLLIRLSGADREVMDKWLYVIVGLVFIAGIIGTAHHYYWIVCRVTGCRSAACSARLSRWRCLAWRCTPTVPCAAQG